MGTQVICIFWSNRRNKGVVGFVDELGIGSSVPSLEVFNLTVINYYREYKNNFDYKYKSELNFCQITENLKELKRNCW